MLGALAHLGLAAGALAALSTAPHAQMWGEMQSCGTDSGLYRTGNERQAWLRRTGAVAGANQVIPGTRVIEMLFEDEQLYSLFGPEPTRLRIRDELHHVESDISRG